MSKAFFNHNSLIWNIGSQQRFFIIFYVTPVIFLYNFI